jgi:hypothetical protein
MIAKSNKGEVSTDWSRFMIYVGFLTCLAAVLTPVIDDGARLFAGSLMVPLVSYIIWHAASRK